MFFLLVVPFVPYPISEFFCFLFVYFEVVLFFVALIARVAFFLLCSRTLYASTWFAYLESLAFGFYLSRCDHRICVSLGRRIRKDTGGTADVVGYKERFIVKTTTTTTTTTTTGTNRAHILYHYIIRPSCRLLAKAIGKVLANSPRRAQLATDRRLRNTTFNTRYTVPTPVIVLHIQQ